MKKASISCLLTFSPLPNRPLHRQRLGVRDDTEGIFRNAKALEQSSAVEGRCCESAIKFGIGWVSGWMGEVGGWVWRWVGGWLSGLVVGG